VETVLDAISAFWDYLASVHRVALALALGCHLVKTVCASRAWRNVLVAAYPDTRVRWLPLYAAWVAGAGVNALFPARIGDVVRLTMAHRAIKGSTYTTLVSSSLVLAIVDALCVTALFSWAVTQGILPSLDVLPYLPSFDFAWFLRHESVAEVALLVLVLGVIALSVWIRANVAEFRQRVRQAFTVVRTPARWLRTVVAWQLAEWALRLATVWFMLGAFRIEQSARNVLLVQAAESLATVVPISPGGIGTQQALLVYTLRGSASRSALVAFSVGMKLTVTCVNVIVGFTAILLTLRTLRFRRASDPAAAADTS
jgi:glycosyltransferase 2 family protein